MRIEIETKYGLGDIVTTVMFDVSEDGEYGYRIGKSKVIAIKTISQEETNKPEVFYLIEGANYDMYGDEAREWLEALDGSDDCHLEGIYENGDIAMKVLEEAEVKIIDIYGNN